MDIKLTQGKHTVDWELNGKSYSAEVEVGAGGGSLSLVKPPVLIHVFDNVKVTKPPK